jgi:oligopeptide/dipeptide ABC transporter ATP-binding protein
MMESILEVKNLVKYYPMPSGLFNSLRRRKRQWVKAVDGVSFELYQNETLGLVGESGSGKSTLGRAVLMLDPPTSGRVTFGDKTISDLRAEKLRLMRKEMQIVFQNPDSSLDPRQQVRDILLEPVTAFQLEKTENVRNLLENSLRLVGLPTDSLGMLPHQFSGGQRQRIAIARALILEPKLIVLDEPTSALDSSVQAQILNLLQKLQEELGLTYLFISHNINVVKYMAERIAVLYAGKIVEIGNTRDVLEDPLHPYTSVLISSVPAPDPDKNTATIQVMGESPSPVNPPSGCRFHPRCKYARTICSTSEPELREIKEGHRAACRFAEEIHTGSIFSK